MEATTEANKDHRELTKTEITIAIAQIEDRLMRVANAQQELSDFCGDYETSEWAKMMKDVPEDEPNDIGDEIIDNLKAKLRVKYEIPNGVHLFLEGLDAALIKDNAKIVMSYVAAFVKGKLDESTMSEMYFFFEECAECDYGWILVEREMGFYDAPSDNDMNEVIGEIRSIGTRAKTKNKKLPKLAGAFSVL